MLLVLVTLLVLVEAAVAAGAVYRLTAVLLPSTSEPPVLVPRSTVAVEFHIFAYSNNAAALDEG